MRKGRLGMMGLMVLLLRLQVALGYLNRFGNWDSLIVEFCILDIMARV